MKKTVSLFLILICTIIISAVSVSAQEYTLNTEFHNKYMDGAGDGRFNPDGNVTRAQMCQIIYNLLNAKPEIVKTFDDVYENDWYYDSVNSLYSAGFVNGKYTDTEFCPNDLISRGETIDLICKFYELLDCTSEFSDVEPDSKFYGAISNAYKNGWINGFDDGTFRPGSPITRAELATVLNNVLNRDADREFIKANDRVRIFVDVEPEHWAYYDITEATVHHTHEITNGEKWLTYTWEKTGLPSGYHMINHYLYYVEEETGQFAVNTSVKNRYFNERGRYTTGHSELDKNLHEVIQGICINEPQNESNLESVYFYVRDNFVYQARQHVPKGATDWELKYAEPMMRSHYGNCYSWASVFMYLTRWIGFDTRCQSGTTGKSNNAHGWTEINFNGEWFIFDPEMENSSRKAGNKSFHKRYYKLPYNNSIRSYVTY